MRKTKTYARLMAAACAVPLMMATPAVAEPTVGLGLTVTFGGGSIDTGVGLRVFSDNRRNRAVASIGLDYMFGQQNFRGTIGAAYLGKNAYTGLDLGYGFGTGQIDFGVGVGGVRTRQIPAPVVNGGDGGGGNGIGNGDYDIGNGDYNPV